MDKEIIDKLAEYNLTPEIFEKILVDMSSRVKLGRKAEIDWIDIVNKYDIDMNPDTIRKAASTIFGGVFIMDYFKDKTADNKALKKEEKYKTETCINKDGSVTSDKLIRITANELKDKNCLLLAHGFDSKEWELVSARNNIWNVYSKQDGIQELYSSKIVVKPKEQTIDYEMIEEWFNKLDRNYSITPINKDYEYLAGDKALLIDIADLHMNLQASMFTTGNEYNCKIAENLFFYVIGDVLSRVEQYNFNKIIFCIGGDMLNGDNLAGSTTKGTPQDSDVHYYDACEQMYAMTIKAIDILKEKASVDVVYVPGNHDQMTGYKLAKYVDAWFKNEKKVNVDYSPLPRKYLKFGKTLFVFAHDGNVKTLPRVIADEAREFWSDIETTEVFLQHLHTEQVLLEDNNMRIQRLPTISSKSLWTVSKGFGSKRQCKSFVFDLEDGLKDVIYTPITNKVLEKIK